MILWWQVLHWRSIYRTLMLKWLEAAGLHFCKDKCFFLRPIGHTLTKMVYTPSKQRCKLSRKHLSLSISHHSLVSSISKFLPKLSSTLTLLYSLLNEDEKWHWDSKQYSKPFKLLRTHYNPISLWPKEATCTGLWCVWLQPLAIEVTKQQDSIRLHPESSVGLSSFQHTATLSGYKPGKQLCNADAFSHLPSPTTTYYSWLCTWGSCHGDQPLIVHGKIMVIIYACINESCNTPPL